MSVAMQIGCVGLICSICLSLGIMYAWPSSTLQLFASDNTTLHRPMTETEQALFGSLSSIGALVGTPFAGIYLDKLGRKRCAIAGSLISVLSWLMIVASDRVEVVLSAIFVSGLSGAVLLIVPVFISEICQESIRGAMTAGSMIFYGVGMLISYLIGGLLEYKAMTYVCLSVSVMSILMISVLKETPVCLMVKGLEEEAAKSIAFYRRLKTDSKEVQEEMTVLRRALNPELDDTTPEEENLKPGMQKKQKLSVWQFFKKSRSTRRAMLVTMVLVTAAIFQGLVVVQVYAEPLFSQTVPSISPTILSVVFAVVVVIAGLIAAWLTELAGRRPLMIYSSLAAGLSCIILGTQIQLHWSAGWLTAVVIYLFCMAYSFGAGTVPFVLLAELFLPEVKSYISMLVVEWTWLCNSVILFIFNPLLKAIGLGPVFYIFAIVCFLTSIFSYYFLPETKGLPVDVIQTLFAKKKRSRQTLY